MNPAHAEVHETIRAFLADADLEWETGARDGEYVVTLPGDRKLKTVTSLLVGEKALTTTAFVIRHPDENAEEFYTFLLRRNLRMGAVAYSIDGTGDVYVGGRVPLAAVGSDYLDDVLGAVLDAADAPFNELLVIGFLSSMKREWAWRIKRGESTRNLEAFAHLLQD
ncbi:YbjN domain-containing protein [Allobranchiibius sp. GilTou73]|uniref:YbjN domain-containing protein n=1 Tax=Allobranchiibius sp. GilTou73 TaxID=2904523 RepID=UPI001F48C384|nr:YbjN domain-containing protein [Allobranchiibius sp. GilTou73]UIJ35977.1 YbjN domain-containing protein [Allobranchiibius sp. GilTou73]